MGMDIIDRKLLELLHELHRRHPHPGTGIRVASAIRAMRIRRVFIGSLRLGRLASGASRLALRGAAVLAGQYSTGCRSPGFARCGRSARRTYNSRAVLRGRDAALEGNCSEITRTRTVVTVPPGRRVRKAGEGLPVVPVGEP